MSNTVLITHRRCTVATKIETTPVELKHRYLSPQQVADQLPGVSTGTLAMWRHEGKGPRYRKLGRIVLYAVDEVDEWVEAAIREGTIDGY